MFTYYIQNLKTGEKAYITCYTILYIGDVIKWGMDSDGETAQWEVIR